METEELLLFDEHFAESSEATSPIGFGEEFVAVGRPDR